MTHTHEPPDDPTPPPTPGAIHDRRVTPRGVVPRHVQMWLMVAMALVIVVIILLTGHPEPLPRPQSSPRPAQPDLVPPDRVRSYEQQLAAEAARLQQSSTPPRGAAQTTRPVGAAAVAGREALTDDARRREFESLFADNVALSRRAADRRPYAEQAPQEPTAPPSASAEAGLLQQLLSRNPAASAPMPSAAASPPAAPGARAPASSTDTPQARAADTVITPIAPAAAVPGPAEGSLQRLFEGTVIETVLLNRLDGTFAGPVACLVTTPVYSHDRQLVVIPAGARVLGTASPVQAWGDSRLAVSFHRVVMPDGRTYSLDHFKGLGQIGDTGLKDRVNRHYLQVFGASLAIGALSGLTQYGTRRSVDTYTFGESYRQASGASLASSADRVLDRYLNVLPTVSIREGYRIKVYLTNDLQLPPYGPVTSGGTQ